MSEIIYTKAAPDAIGPYSQAIKTNGFVFTSGQIALNPADNTVSGKTIREQTHRVCQNLAAVLEKAGSGFDRVVKTTCFLADMNDFADFNKVYAEYFTSKPARSCVAAAALPKGVKIEIECIAESRD